MWKKKPRKYGTRGSQAYLDYASKKAREQWQTGSIHGFPKSDELRLKMSKAVTRKERRVRSDRAFKRAMDEKHRWGNTGKWNHVKRGTRDDLGLFLRSKSEANYARYLKFLVEKGKILSWEYEPKTFIFEAVQLGTRSYTPDFKVYNLDGTYEWHEVKGWMDKKSKVKLNRMAKYYPDEKVVIISCKKEMKEIQNSVSRLIEHWED